MDSTLQDQILTQIARQMSDEMNRQILGLDSDDQYQLVYDTGTVYGARYYTVAPVWATRPFGPNPAWAEMMAWCVETFGKSEGSIWAEKTAPNPGERWYANNAKFWFRDQRDRDWFTLRWS